MYGHKVPYLQPTELCLQPKPEPLGVILIELLPPEGSMTFVRLFAAGCWVWAIVAGSFLRDGATAIIALIAALFFTAWGMVAG